MKEATKYDTVLQELRSEFDMLMQRYLQNLCNALYADDGQEISHKYIVNRIKGDCVSICTNKLGRITFDELRKELVFREVRLQDRYDIAEFCPHCGEETIPVVGQDVSTSK